jgi:hypothetical protein
MWWMNTKKKWAGTSPRVYYAAGYGGIILNIDNVNDLVVTTRWMDDSKMEFMKLVDQSISSPVQQKIIILFSYL